MFVLQEKVNGKFQNVSGKFQYGAIPHAKRRAEKDYGGKLFWGTHGDEWAGMDKRGKTWYKISLQSSNPMKKKRKKNPEHEIRELILFSENSPALHNQYTSIMKNLSRKKKRGVYDPVLAAKLWKYWIDEGVKQYNKEVLGGGYSLRQNVFTMADRKQAAIEMEDQEQEGVFSMEYLQNPKGRKVAKKKRSAKQLANDKRLGRMAKARAAKKRGGAHKKTTHKKVAKGNPKAKDPAIGKRVALHPATSEWMQGDRYGEIIGLGNTLEYINTFTKEKEKIRPYRVKLDKSGRTIRLPPSSITFINPTGRGGARKKTARKVTKRRVVRNPSARSFSVIFKCKGNNLMFLMNQEPGARSISWSKDRKYAAAYFYPHLAERTAKKIAKLRGLSQYMIGVAKNDKSIAEIKVHCSGKV